MSGKAAAAIIAISSCFNLMGIMWYMILAPNSDTGTVIGSFIITLFMVIFSAAALGEKKK